MILTLDACEIASLVFHSMLHENECEMKYLMKILVVFGFCFENKQYQCISYYDKENKNFM